LANKDVIIRQQWQGKYDQISRKKERKAPCRTREETENSCSC